MKKIISNEEIIKKAKEWVASFTFDEFSKMLEEEIRLSELDELNNSKWLENASEIEEKNYSMAKYGTTIIKDEGKNAWTLSGEYNKNKNEKIDIPNDYVEFSFDFEKAA